LFYPGILKINENIYNDIPISIIVNCKSDTCPSYESFESYVLKDSFFGDTISILKKDFNTAENDTLIIFDPNDLLVDKTIPVKIDSSNCIKIYLARKAKFNFIEIPQKYRIKKKRIDFIDSKGKIKYFKITKD
jgi:hypothetical protein